MHALLHSLQKERLYHICRAADRLSFGRVRNTRHLMF